MSVSLPPFLLLWMLLLALLALGALVIWQNRQDNKRLAAQRGVGDMLLDRLQQANAELSAAVKAEKDAIQSIAILPEDADPLEAERVLRRAMPHSSFHDRRALMLYAWEVQKRPQALTVLAGMALADLENTYSSLGIMFRTAISQGSAALLDHIARVLDQRRDALDNWLLIGGLPVFLEQAATRVEGEAPDVAARLLALANSLSSRWAELLMRHLRFNIDSWEEQEDVAPLDMAAALAKCCPPRFPELVAEAQRALSRHAGPEWEKAPVWFDKVLLHHFYDVPVGLTGFNRENAVERLSAGIMSADADVSLFCATHGADLLGDGFYDAPEYHDALQSALDWAVRRHGLNPTYEWLDKELNPVDVSAEKLGAAEESLAQHARINAGVKTVLDTTATIDPEVALAEIRQVMPDAPAEMLRVAFTARWQVDHTPMSLVALLGVALEVMETEPVDGRMVSLCLHWPLRDGSAAVVDAAVEMLDRHFETLDDWVHWENSILDLEGAATRLAGSAPDNAGRAAALLARAKARRVPLLAASIAARLAEVDEGGEKADPFKMMLDVYRWCLPDHQELGAPVRAMLAARNDERDWRMTQFWLEGSVIKHFAEQGKLGGYDFDAALRLLADGIKDHDAAVADAAATTAADLVRRGLVRAPDDLLALDEAVAWAVPLHPTPPPAFDRLRAEIRGAASHQDAAG